MGMFQTTQKQVTTSPSSDENNIARLTAAITSNRGMQRQVEDLNQRFEDLDVFVDTTAVLSMGTDELSRCLFEDSLQRERAEGSQ